MNSRIISFLNQQTRSIVAIGDGITGTTLLKSSIWGMLKEYQAIPVSEDICTTFNPVLPEVVGASIFPKLLYAYPRNECLRMSIK